VDELCPADSINDHDPPAVATIEVVSAALLCRVAMRLVGVKQLAETSGRNRPHFQINPNDSQYLFLLRCSSPLSRRHARR